MVSKNQCSFVQGTFHSFYWTLLQYMGTSCFSVVSLRVPSDKMPLYLWCAKINVVSFRVHFILLTKPITTYEYLIQTLLQYMGISYFSVVSLRGPSDKMLLFMWCAKINVVSLRVPLILLIRPFYHIWISHISV